MKKIWMISIAALLAVSLSGCGVGDVGGPESSAAPNTNSQTASSAILSDKVKESSVEDNLAGLQKYLVGDASVPGTPETMRADFIGAKSGVRYKYGYNGKDNVTLELYEFASSNLNSTAKKVLSEVKDSGQFTLMDQKVDAVLSDSGKYLMILKDTSSDDVNVSYVKQVKNLFRGFKKD
jgi:outer membrane lipoprotein SlyB